MSRIHRYTILNKDPRMAGTRVDHNKQNDLPAKFSFWMHVTVYLPSANNKNRFRIVQPQTAIKHAG